jgi:hypothetical protein
MATLISTARTTYAEVSEIIQTTLTEAQVNAFINSASRLVSATLATAGLASDVLEDIEMWLAAHLLSTRDMRAQQEALGSYSVTYQGQTGLGLDATFYGQQVKLLDTSGLLANVGKQAASFWAE